MSNNLIIKKNYIRKDINICILDFIIIHHKHLFAPFNDFNRIEIIRVKSVMHTLRKRIVQIKQDTHRLLRIYTGPCNVNT